VTANYMGTGVAFLVEAHLVKNGITVDQVNLGDAVLASIGLVLVLLFTQHRPSIPANISSKIVRKRKIITDMKSMLRNLPFVYSTIFFSAVVGVSLSVNLTISEFLNPNGHHLIQVSNMGIIYTLVGTIC